MAWGAMALLIGLAFLAAWITQGWNLLSLTPPATEAVPTPAPDVAVGEELSLYQSAYTAWAALVLLIPAYLFIWGRPSAWLAFWTTSYLAYLVHLAVSGLVFFGGDFAAMTSSSRVSAFWPGMGIVLWWGIDIALALASTRGRWVTAQRVALHLLVLVLFVGGSAVKGELMMVQLIGWALLGLALAAGLKWKFAP